MGDRGLDVRLISEEVSKRGEVWSLLISLSIGSTDGFCERDNKSLGFYKKRKSDSVLFVILSFI